MFKFPNITFTERRFFTVSVKKYPPSSYPAMCISCIGVESKALVNPLITSPRRALNCNTITSSVTTSLI
jgi:hypothetical protein